MILANLQLANPVLFTVQNSYVGYQNTTPNGIVFSKTMRYPASGSPYAQRRSLIRLNFADIPPADITSYRQAFDLATQAYVILSVPGLGLTLQLDSGPGLTDTAWVTVAPSTSFVADLQVGFTRSEENGLMDGPYLYNFTWAFVTGDYFYSNGG
jgi:hypothetical protein